MSDGRLVFFCLWLAAWITVNGLLLFVESSVAPKMFRMMGAVGIAWGDVVAAESRHGDLWYKALVTPSGHITLQIVFVSGGLEREAVVANLKRLSCGWEGSDLPNLIAVDVPIGLQSVPSVRSASLFSGLPGLGSCRLRQRAPAPAGPVPTRSSIWTYRGTSASPRASGASNASASRCSSPALITRSRHFSTSSSGASSGSQSVRAIRCCLPVPPAQAKRVLPRR